ncbi:hypothetical protein EVJ50_01360 [Synechococcus sp. RSCCF101]|uniref:hypothetical protein n=1 Tax=Synechococcus sp. RSCCF101 TaxID=2511069 RepID=UPI0012444EEB|nr:hypothetical protein [Synechococcus sp. RSCCF101]QEY31101.1 hypothetical protein EVJ50_01360 [Synechococcus sp. RSCCF101]
MKDSESQPRIWSYRGWMVVERLSRSGEWHVIDPERRHQGLAGSTNEARLLIDAMAAAAERRPQLGFDLARAR